MLVREQLLQPLRIGFECLVCHKVLPAMKKALAHVRVHPLQDENEPRVRFYIEQYRSRGYLHATQSICMICCLHHANVLDSVKHMLRIHLTHIQTIEKEVALGLAHRDCHRVTVQCNRCHLVLMNAREYLRHVESEHAVTRQVVQEPANEQGFYVCPTCAKCFTQYSRYRSHKITHTRPRYCAQCDRDFETAKGFTNHKRSKQCK